MRRGLTGAVGDVLKRKAVDSPPLLTLKLVDRPQDVTESTSGLEVEETFGLKAAEQQ